MRELNTEELASVSGAGYIADMAAALGKGIGDIIDASHKGGTLAPFVGELLGRGIGTAVEVSVTIVQFFMSGLSTLFPKQ